MCPAVHLVRTMYSPGFVGSPSTTAFCAPLVSVLHLIWSGFWIVIAAGFRSAGLAAARETIATAASAANHRTSLIHEVSMISSYVALLRRAGNPGASAPSGSETPEGTAELVLLLSSLLKKWVA